MISALLTPRQGGSASLLRVHDRHRTARSCGQLASPRQRIFPIRPPIASLGSEPGLLPRRTIVGPAGASRPEEQGSSCASR